MRDELEELLRVALEEQGERDRVRDWRASHPYVADIIAALSPGGSQGVARRKALDTIERTRRANVLPIPRYLEQTVQSVFNQHCVDSYVFRRRNVPADGLFSSRRVGNAAYWIVDRERAARWLAERCVVSVIAA